MYVHRNWPLVDEADRIELFAFVKLICFRARRAERGDNTLDCVWAHKWKLFQNPDGTTRWINKSRLCGRGLLDEQKRGESPQHHCQPNVPEDKRFNGNPEGPKH